MMRTLLKVRAAGWSRLCANDRCTRCMLSHSPLCSAYSHPHSHTPTQLIDVVFMTEIITRTAHTSGDFKKLAPKRVKAD